MFWRRRKPSDFNAEIEGHLQLEADRLKEQGLADDEARMAARRSFGNATKAQEHFYESTPWLFLDTLSQDFRFGLRMLAKNPGSTAIAVLALAFGIGINTAIFSILNAALLKFLPVRNPTELVMLTNPNASLVLGGRQTGERSLLSYTEFTELRDRATSLSGLWASQMLLQRWPIRVSGGAQEEAQGRLVSENYFSVLGVEPAFGRFFTPQKDSSVVISYHYWQRRFHGDPSVLGTPIRFHQTTLIIIGVAAKGFRGETVGQDPDLWLPMLMQPLLMPGVHGLDEYMNQSHDKLMWLHVFGRRKPGVPIAQVQAEINVLFRGILNTDKDALNQHIAVKALRSGAFHGREEFSEQWTIFSVLAGLVLLIACANVANLLLARATARTREVAIRIAIGAPKARLFRQFLTESLLFAALGGAAGMLVAVAALRVLLRLLSSSGDALHLAAAIDLRVLGFSACAILLTGILFGLAPAFRSTRIVVKTGSSERTILAKAFVVAQVALSFLLIMGAGLFLRTLWNLQSVALGYPRQNLLLVHVDTEGAGYQPAPTVNLDHELAERIRRIPGVHSVTFSDRSLFAFDGAFPVTVEGFTRSQEDERGSTATFVGPGYFSSIGIPMRLGREIESRDTPKSPPVCVINEAFAKRFFPGRNPIGKHVTSTFPRPMEVVGVAADARVRSLRGHIDPKFYAPADQTGGASWFEIRTTVDPNRVLQAVRKTILAMDGDLSIESARTLDELIEAQNAQPRLVAELCAAFGILALFLAATGIYGILSYTVARRTNEIGIRMALGADKRLVARMILQETGAMLAIGMIAGGAATAAMARLLASQLYGFASVGPRWSLAQYQHVDSATQLYGLRAMDLPTLGVAVCILCLAGLIAAYAPAARAARVDPMHALRHG
jgi:predicted permease